MFTALQPFCTSLGTTKEEVAINLGKLGIKGNRRDRKSCPLYNAIRALADPEFDWNFMLPIHFPGPCGDFMIAFDSGEFPELQVI